MSFFPVYQVENIMSFAVPNLDNNHLMSQNVKWIYFPVTELAQSAIIFFSTNINCLSITNCCYLLQTCI